jgi:hypothetical protein
MLKNLCFVNIIINFDNLMYIFSMNNLMCIFFASKIYAHNFFSNDNLYIQPFLLAQFIMRIPFFTKDNLTHNVF